jgi:hypothetical protein
MSSRSDSTARVTLAHVSEARDHQARHARERGPRVERLGGDRPSVHDGHHRNAGVVRERHVEPNRTPLLLQRLVYADRGARLGGAHLHDVAHLVDDPQSATRAPLDRGVKAPGARVGKPSTVVHLA